MAQGVSSQLSSSGAAQVIFNFSLWLTSNGRFLVLNYHCNRNLSQLTPSVFISSRKIVVILEWKKTYFPCPEACLHGKDISKSDEKSWTVPLVSPVHTSFMNSRLWMLWIYISSTDISKPEDFWNRRQWCKVCMSFLVSQPLKNSVENQMKRWHGFMWGRHVLGNTDINGLDEKEGKPVSAVRNCIAKTTFPWHVDWGASSKHLPHPSILELWRALPELPHLS